MLQNETPRDVTDPQDMTADEPLNTLAVWEAERSVRWAQVSARSGAEHTAALHEYMAARDGPGLRDSVPVGQPATSEE